MISITSIVTALIVFSILVFIHELGHFIAARIFKVNVREFALGMGPALFKKKWGDTEYSIRLIPMGGFCKMEGEDPAGSGEITQEEERKYDSEGSFHNKNWWQRSIILAAGAFMNVVLAFVMCILLVGLKPAAITMTIASTVPEADSSRVVMEGDRIVSINGTKTNIIQDISLALQGEETYQITVERNGEIITDTIKLHQYTTESGAEAKEWGIRLKREDMTLSSVFRESWFTIIWMGKIVYVSLGMLFSGEADMSDISGPIGIFGVIGTAVSEGSEGGILELFMELLYLSALLGVNIGLLNLFPLPALDGGRIVFAVIEGIRRKPINPEHEGIVHSVGMLLLIGLLLYASYNDVIKLIFGAS